MAAQRLLFQIIYLESTRQCQRLERTLRTSSHLVQHIHWLSLNRSHRCSIEIEAFEKICKFPFTHLETVEGMDLGTMPLETVVPLQWLFSLPTVRTVSLISTFDDPAIFFVMWEGCSPALRRLHLRCHTKSGEPVHPTIPTLPQSSPPVALVSLLIDSWKGVDEWLLHDLCPFDFSRLALLSVTALTAPILFRPRMASALETIEVLEIEMNVSDGAFLDLSLLSNLQFLRIEVASYLDFEVQMAIALDTLSTLTSASPIRQIVISGCGAATRNAQACDQFDTKVASLPLQHLSSVGLETSLDLYSHSVPLFPRLYSKNLVCRCPFQLFFFTLTLDSSSAVVLTGLRCVWKL
jgi:hypothetical protein